MKTKQQRIQERIEIQYLDYVKNGVVYKSIVRKSKKQKLIEEENLLKLLFCWEDDFEYFEKSKINNDTRRKTSIR